MATNQQEKSYRKLLILLIFFSVIAWFTPPFIPILVLYIWGAIRLTCANILGESSLSPTVGYAFFLSGLIGLLVCTCLILLSLRSRYLFGNYSSGKYVFILIHISLLWLVPTASAFWLESLLPSGEISGYTLGFIAIVITTYQLAKFWDESSSK